MNDRQIANHIANLGHKDPNVRRHAANALGEIGDPAAVPALIATLNDRTDFVRRKAILALKKIGAPSIPALARMVQSREKVVRKAACDALMEFGDASALPTVIAALKDDDLFVREAAVTVLFRIGDASAVPALIAVLRDKYDAMWRYKYDVVEREMYAAALARASSASFRGSFFSESLGPSEHRHNQVRCQAIDVLGTIGSASAVPALIESLKDEDYPVRSNAARVLGVLGEISSVSALIEAWNTLDRWERPHSHGALWRMGDAVTLPRKILAESRFSAQEKIDLLENLRRVRSEGKDSSGNKADLHYQFPETAALCQEVLQEEDTEARKGAQSVLNWLNGERHLLHASQEDTKKHSEELVRPASGNDGHIQPQNLLRPSEKSEQATQPSHARPALWQRLFGKQKDFFS